MEWGLRVKRIPFQVAMSSIEDSTTGSEETGKFEVGKDVGAWGELASSLSAAAGAVGAVSNEGEQR